MNGVLREHLRQAISEKRVAGLVGRTGLCPNCFNRLPEDRPSYQKYCSNECQIQDCAWRKTHD